MTKFANLCTSILTDSNLGQKIPATLKNKIETISASQSIENEFLITIDFLKEFDALNIYFPGILTFLLEDIERLLLLDNSTLSIVLNSINFWQDWKTGLKLIENINNQNLDPEKWYLLSNLTFKLGQLCYSLYKGSNYALTLLFFEKTLNYISKAPNERKVILILSATLWFIGRIEFEKGYSIKASDYELSSMYYQKEINQEEFEEYFQSNRISMRNSFILSTFQGSTDFFIASKVAAQTFQIDSSKNYLNHSYLYINRILRILRSDEQDQAILEQIRTFLLQLHSVIDKEGFLVNHSCDLQLLSSGGLEKQVLIDYVSNHLLLLDDKDKRIIWLTVLDKGGISLFEYDFEEEKVTSKNTLYSSFIHVISRWGEVELESGPVQELNFLGNSFIIELVGDTEVIAVVSKPTTEFHYAIRIFANKFDKEFSNVLNSDWKGNIKIFETKSLELIEDLKKKL